MGLTYHGINRTIHYCGALLNAQIHPEPQNYDHSLTRRQCLNRHLQCQQII
jgi:hypothetical protein